MSVPPPVVASPSEVLVSTSPSKSGLIASGPVGTIATTSRSVRVAISVQASPAAAALSTVTVAPGSVFAYASCTTAVADSIAARNASSRSPATEQTAIASRGIALRLLPPSSDTSRNGATSYASRSTRPSTLIAFARPSAICTPEWPPSPPPARTESETASAEDAARGASTRIHVSVLPAQPTVRTPSSSLSRLISVPPVSRDPSSAFAPSSPTSSATVIKSSSGPCGIDSSSTSVIIAAIAIPSSAPRVVPSAVSQSPSRTNTIRPSAGSFGLEGSRSQTMSRWPWRISVGADSRPGVAGTRMTRFRPASCSSSNPRAAAQARTCSITGSSRREGRAIRVSASKFSQNGAGSAPASAEDVAATCQRSPTWAADVSTAGLTAAILSHVRRAVNWQAPTASSRRAGS